MSDFVRTRLESPFLWGLVVITTKEFEADSEWVSHYQHSSSVGEEISDFEKKQLVGNLVSNVLVYSVLVDDRVHYLYKIEICDGSKKHILDVLAHFLKCRLLQWREVVYGGHGLEEAGDWVLKEKEIICSDDIFPLIGIELERHLCRFYLNCCYSHIWKTKWTADMDCPFFPSSTKEYPLKPWCLPGNESDVVRVYGKNKNVGIELIPCDVKGYPKLK